LEIIAYDGDKFVTIRVGGISTTVKAGYLYTQPGRCGEVPVFNLKNVGPPPG
jgi:hypothetical protein